MKDRRYPEGGVAPKLVFPDRSSGYSDREAFRKKRRTKWLVPIGDDYLSPTSDARACFVDRNNSKIFQQFALNYAYNIVKTVVLSGEV